MQDLDARYHGCPLGAGMTGSMAYLIRNPKQMVVSPEQQ